MTYHVPLRGSHVAVLFPHGVVYWQGPEYRHATSHADAFAGSLDGHATVYSPPSLVHREYWHS